MKSEADYYDVLGVERSATEEDIRRAFRKLAMEWHPDRNKEKDAEERFKTVNEAYQVLIDPAKRQQYDRFGRAGVGGMEWPTGRGFEGAGFPGGGFGDIFDAFFGGFGVERETGPRRGADLHVTLQVTFQEAIFGVEKDVEVLRTELCSLCGGSRAAEGTKPVTCSNCRGSGQVRRSQTGFFGQFVQIVTCSVCRGEGRVVETPCRQCNGVGRERRTRHLNVRIPAGVDDGMQVRLTGEGEAGWNKGPAGSVYITLNVSGHSMYRRSGQDLVIDVPVNVAQAALGDIVDVPLLGEDDGTEELKVPAGVQPGTVLRVKGKGVPNVGNGRRGDLLAVVQVVTPRRLDPDARKLFQDLAEVLSRNPSGNGARGKSWTRKVKDALAGEEG